MKRNSWEIKERFKKNVTKGNNFRRTSVCLWVVSPDSPVYLMSTAWRIHLWALVVSRLQCSFTSKDTTSNKCWVGFGALEDTGFLTALSMAQYQVCKSCCLCLCLCLYWCVCYMLHRLPICSGQQFSSQDKMLRLFMTLNVNYCMWNMWKALDTMSDEWQMWHTVLNCLV